MKLNLFFISIALFISTSCESEINVGEIEIRNSDNLYFRVYRKDNFEWVNPTYCQILDNEDNQINQRQLLNIEIRKSNINRFEANQCGSIIYLRGKKGKTIYFIYNLQENIGYLNINDNKKRGILK